MPENLLEMLKKTRDNVHFIKAMEEYMRICQKEGYTAPETGQQAVKKMLGFVLMMLAVSQLHARCRSAKQKTGGPDGDSAGHLAAL